MSVNRVTLIGNACADAESRYMTSGEQVVTLRLATNEYWKDKQGVKQEKAEYHNLVFFNKGSYKLAEIAGEMIKKGAKVYIEGKLQTRKWTDKSGQDKWSTEIIVNEFQMLSKVERKEEKYEPEQKYTAPVSGPAGGLMDMADDLPFLDPYKFCWRSV